MSSPRSASGTRDHLDGWRRARPLGGPLSGVAQLGHLERAAILAAIVATVILAAVPVAFAGDPLAIVAVPLEPPSSAHWLGTDDLGRDLFIRVLYGMRTTWFVSFPVIAGGILIGGLIGGIAGALGGWPDIVLMRFTDVMLALPAVLVTIATAAALGAGLVNTLIAVSITFWTPYARIVRGEVRRIRTSPHLEAARQGGSRGFGLALRHVVPGMSGPVVVQATLDVSTVIMTLASLSFLGLGSPPPAPELGAMTAKSTQFIFTAWWLPIAPAMAVVVLSVIGNLFGDAMNDWQTLRTGRPRV